MSDPYTPGPWTRNRLNNEVYAPLPDGRRARVARVIYGGAPDALLIAAAPDLLDVCRRLRQAHERGLIHPPDDLDLIPACYAAIAKAAGGAVK